MKRLSPAQQKMVVDQWTQAAAALQRARDEELRKSGYDWTTVDALLDIGARLPFKEREPNGLVEMQRLFLDAARRQGLLPARVRERPAPYGRKPPRRPTPARKGKPC